MSTNHYLMSRKPVPFNYYFEYGQIKRWFLDVINQAQEFVRAGEIDKGIWTYETLIEHRYPNYKPYDLLIKLYRKHKDFENEQRILHHSISFFTDLKESQKEYVISLAMEYNMESVALEYINAGKKIHYYGGAFVLWDPVSVLSVWENNLSMLTQKTNEFN
ncbi:hypothetical protein [Dyadobacter sp. LHD-138]|uniref:hypothetical protein n=1 Tax=Dyadobacter sp. LHD-138 TaxID=3071413 RepID=UPI0027E1A79B|nr:hypothetical protein [Dyadobacter sp. LHD-138]MDQ6481611.1 hypothetical protein [Dyadobacter sp. LHD-138]